MTAEKPNSIPRKMGAIEGAPEKPRSKSGRAWRLRTGILGGGCFLLSLVGISSLADGQDSSWDFAAGIQGWRAWGMPSEIPEDKHAFEQILAWDDSKGHTAPGSLRISDLTDRFNPYAISPTLKVEPGETYVVTGWVWVEKDQPLPVVLAMFYTSASMDHYVSNVNSSSGRDVFGDPDAQGWRRFEFHVSKVPTEAAFAVIGVRPAPDDKDPAFTGTVWLNDVQWRGNSDKPLALAEAMNRGFKDEVAGDGKGGWTDQGDNDLRGMKPGRLEAQNIAFDIVDPAKNSDHSVMALRSNAKPWFLDRAEIPLNGRKFERLYLLHAAAWCGAGDLVGYVDLIASNGEKHTQEIRGNQALADWWSVASNIPTALAVPLTDVNPRKSPVALYIYSVDNPAPQLPMQSVVFRAPDHPSPATWLVLAATTSNGPSKIKLVQATKRDMSQWTPFVPGIRPTSKEAVSLEFLLDAPAGKHGFNRVGKDGHFEFEDGTPVRFWGANLHSNGSLFPTHEQAQAVADTLSRMGCNLVRFHLPQVALVRYDERGNRGFVDDNMWERFEYFVKCLKDKGIYILMDSILGLSDGGFEESDGVHDYQIYNQHEHTSWAYFDPRLRELGRKFLDALLSHPNRYTGKCLAQDPVLALVTCINEQSVFWDWNFKKEPAYYTDELRQLFNQWLLQQNHDRDGLAKAWKLPDGGTALKTDEDPARGTVELPEFYLNQDELGKAVSSEAIPAERVRALAVVQFLHHLQSDFFDYAAKAGAKLGLRIPIIGTNISEDMAELHTMLPYRVASQNAYWDLSETSGFYSLSNIPEVTVNPLEALTQQPVSIISTSRMAGCAVTSTENNTSWPHEWRSAALPMVAAYSALERNDALMQYAYNGGFNVNFDYAQKADAILYTCNAQKDPATIAGFAAGALLYLRGDVSPARSLVRLQMDPKMNWACQSHLRDGSFPANYVPYVTGFEYAFAGQKLATPGNCLVIHERGNSPIDSERLAHEVDQQLKAKGLIPSDTGIQEGRLVSDTRQLVRDWKRQLFLYDTPHSQGFAGFPTREPLKFHDLTVFARSPFMALQVSSLDHQGLDKARRMLVIASARADNSAATLSFLAQKPMPMGGARGEFMTYPYKPHGPDTESAGPVLIEPVNVTLQMSGRRMRLTPMDPDMIPIKSSAKEFEAQDVGRVDVPLDQVQASVWYLLERL